MWGGDWKSVAVIATAAPPETKLAVRITAAARLINVCLPRRRDEVVDITPPK